MFNQFFISSNKVFLLYGSSCVALNLHLVRKTLYIGCKYKVFLLYASSCVVLKVHLLKMTLYIEYKNKVVLMYGSSSVALKLLFLRMTLYIHLNYTTCVFHRLYYSRLVLLSLIKLSNLYKLYK